MQEKITYLCVHVGWGRVTYRIPIITSSLPTPGMGYRFLSGTKEEFLVNVRFVYQDIKTKEGHIKGETSTMWVDVDLLGSVEISQLELAGFENWCNS